MKKNKMLAVILSFLIPGVGQLYLGEKKKGIIFLILLFGVYILAATSDVATVGILILIVASIWDCFRYKSIDA